MSFFYILKVIGKLKSNNFEEKNVQVQLMSFYNINVETKINIFFSNLKKCTNPANEFLLHECRNKNKKMIFF